MLSFPPRRRGRLVNIFLSDLSNGGRGIRNQVEWHLVNPLSRASFDVNASPGPGGGSVDISCGAVTTLKLEVC